VDEEDLAERAGAVAPEVLLMAPHRSTVTRHEAKEIDPCRVAPLGADHPALSEARTIFPATVTPSRESPRFLISGHNNVKLGKEVLKGPLKGAAIYQLTLQERATCPTSCLQWSSCYGNSMPFARRHMPDAEFERYLGAEVITLARQHPDGLLIRLHVLGDFYSVPYVYLWAKLLQEFPQLHVFGYTARRVSDPDPESARIAEAIKVLTDGLWLRFAIRTSGGDEERSKAIVVYHTETAGAAGAIVCPAQTKDSEACATCGLCWAPAMRDRTIAFLKHGRKLRGPAAVPANDDAPRPEHPVAPRAPRGRPKQAHTLSMIERVAELLSQVGRPMKPREIAEKLGADYGHVTRACQALNEAKRAHYGWGPAVDGHKSKLLSPLSGTARVNASLPARTLTEIARAAPVVALKPSHVIPIRTRIERPAAAPSADDLPELPTRPGDRTLVGRKPGQCAWPVNDPGPGRGEHTIYCCAPVAGKLQYCADHAKAMFTPKPKGGRA
jgi:hypothetical protein